MALFGNIRIPCQPDLDNIRNLDRLPIPMIRAMQTAGFAIDVDYCHDLSSMFDKEMRELEKDIANYVPPDQLHLFASKSTELEAEEGDASVNPASAEQVRTLLFDVLGIGGKRELKLTKDHKISTGKKQLELIKEDHPVVQLILNYRERAKLKTTYTDALPRIAVEHKRTKPGEVCQICGRTHLETHKRVHTEIPTTRAATGRLASRNPNLTNIPARTELGAAVRAAFVASPGKVLVGRDFSQIELRDLAHAARAKSMIQVYQEDKDIHVFTACAAFDLDYNYYTDLINRPKKLLSVDEKSKLEHFKQFNRLPSKNLNFMIVYGATVMGLLAQLALSGLLWDEDEGNKFIERWFNLYPEVKEFMDWVYYCALKYGFVWDDFGRVRRVPEVFSTHSWIRDAGLRQAGNHPIQSIAAGQLKLTMGRLWQSTLNAIAMGMGVWPLIAVHDQLIYEVDEEDVEDFDGIMDADFKNVMWDEEWGEHRFLVPIKSDGEKTTRWVKD